MACSPASDSTEHESIGGFLLDAESLHQWRLPGRLREISGLALTPDDRLFAVSDEQAVIYELDFLNGKIRKSFALGEPTVRGDFEGIAYLNDLFYLVTSDGMIYSAAEGNDGDRVSFKIYDTGLGGLCEFEGLADDERTGILFLSCKRSLKKNNALSLFAWSAASGRLLHDQRILIPEDEIVERISKKNIRPSAIVIDPETRNVIGVAASQRAIFQIGPNGEMIDAITLPLAKRHRQSEGIEITRDGKLLIADEGGKKKARLSVYASGHNKAAVRQE